MASRAINDRAAYGIPEASRYLRMQPSTLRTWTNEGGLIQSPHEGYLSFNNLLEAHILRALRRRYKFSMQKLRKLLPAAGKLMQTERPLLHASFATDGVNLFLETDQDLINLSKKNQLAFRELVSLYTDRIGRGESGQPMQLFPFIAAKGIDEPKSISINPRVSFGRSVLSGTGIATEVIAGRFAGRDSIFDLAREYQVAPSLIEDAIRWETPLHKAA